MCGEQLFLLLIRCRAPDDPHRQLIKRVIALEHNTVWDDVALKAEKIPQVSSLPGKGEVLLLETLHCAVIVVWRQII